jgi:hypothetical protein
LKKRVRLVRQTWIKQTSETFESRVYELYLKQTYPLIDITYIGGDFSLSYDIEQEETRNVMLLGSLTEDPLNFLNLQPYISMVNGVKISGQQSKVRQYFSAELLFKSETFRREFSSISIGTQDIPTQVFLENLGIKCVYLGYTSSLLGLIEEEIDSYTRTLDYLFIDLSDELIQALELKIASDTSFVEISTEVPEMLGELEKNSKVDSLISLLRATKVVITSSPIFAFAAHSLGKEVIFVEDAPSSELLAVSEEELIDGLLQFDVTKFSHSIPQKRILEIQNSLKEFIEESLNSSDNVRVPFETSAFKDQVVSEVVNSIAKSNSYKDTEIATLRRVIMDKDLEINNLLMSTTWKMTVPIRKFFGFVTRIKNFRFK